MFSKCCGCNHNNKNRGIDKKLENLKFEDIKENPLPNNKKTIELPILNTIEEQPKTTSNTDGKRQSILSDIKIEISENDDDVFSEGVGPPIKLAENLGNPSKRGQDLPGWFTDEDEIERGGVQEPPATPIGRDELALRRHRFFSELLTAAQNVNEHKVRFDPLGPVVAGVSNSEFSAANDLESIVQRLENVTTRLEKLCYQSDTTPQRNSKGTTPIQTDIERKAPIMSVQGFIDIIQGPLAQYLASSKQIGDVVATHSDIVNKAFQAQLDYVTLASQSSQPNQTQQIPLLKPTSEQITAIQEFREKNRSSKFFNHLSAISESIPALGWVTVSPAPAPYVQELNNTGQFYTNRVLKEWKEKDKKHVEWVKAWVQTLTELQAYVKQHHTTGLVWSGKTAPTGGCAPPPPPGCPPPPPILADMPEIDDSSNDRSALFAEINQGENITKSLKKVTADMQTHKNPTLRQGPAPFKAPQSSIKSVGAPVDKPPSFVRDGKKWLIEYQKGNHNLLVENAEMNNVVYLFGCTESTVVVKGKINSITLDSCKKTSVVFDSLVSSMEFINCQSVQMQVFGKVPTISVDKTDGCQIYLSQESLDVVVVSSKSSEMNVLVPKGNGDYVRS
ncbi:adenylyl cyclase-associated protein [Holotrichia oblita]|uniref:Adenylyl cyclase-associated protein n=1 Tax=Holotrichia oblita TaxID=644536 RepID=A0ACB9SHG7_HOLOL|nr:adenylyl cyclase-associated protein [Holotrichia oblita]